MNKFWHAIYLYTMALIVIVFTFYIGYYGYSFYNTPVEERFYHSQYNWFKPSGIFGHGLGIIGTLLILIGVLIYIARKKYGFMEQYIRVKYMLEFHIFLCTLGPIMVLFHTSFKFGGIVSIAFWSMVAVVLSGVVGRYIYLQIPRSIEGNELSLQEIQTQQQALLLQYEAGVASGKVQNKNWDRTQQRKIASFNRKIKRLQLMQNLFKYWHVIHRPFALIMLVIVIVHVVVTVLMGYKWIW